jgi:hypothetical protein
VTITLTNSRVSTPSKRAAPGHSGKYNTVKRSETRLSRIALYSASLEDFAVFVLPDLKRAHEIS